MARCKLLFFFLFQCFAEKEYQTERNLREHRFWNKRNPGDLEWTSRKQRGSHEVGVRAQGVGAPPPSWAPRSSIDVLLSPIYILLYPKNIQGNHETTFPPPQPYVPMRSHLGASSGDLPEGDSITEGFYINTITSLMKHAQFTTDL